MYTREKVDLDAETRERFYEAMRAPARPSRALRMLMNHEVPGFEFADSEYTES